MTATKPEISVYRLAIDTECDYADMIVTRGRVRVYVYATGSDGRHAGNVAIFNGSKVWARLTIADRPELLALVRALSRRKGAEPRALLDWIAENGGEAAEMLETPQPPADKPRPTFADTDKYRIVRFFQRGGRRQVDSGLTLEESQAHCLDPETSSSTCLTAAARRRTTQRGPWFDGYERD